MCFQLGHRSVWENMCRCYWLGRGEMRTCCFAREQDICMEREGERAEGNRHGMSEIQRTRNAPSKHFYPWHSTRSLQTDLCPTTGLQTAIGPRTLLFWPRLMAAVAMLRLMCVNSTRVSIGPFMPLLSLLVPKALYEFSVYAHIPTCIGCALVSSYRA